MKGAWDWKRKSEEERSLSTDLNWDVDGGDQKTTLAVDVDLRLPVEDWAASVR